MKDHKTRRCSHAGSWYSNNSKKLREKITLLLKNTENKNG